MSIRPLHTFVNWSFALLCCGRLTGSKPPPTSLKLHPTLLLSPSSFNSTRYFQPIHFFFYNLFFPREQTRRNPRDSSHTATKKKSERLDRPMQLLLLFFSERHVTQHMLHCLRTGTSACAMAYGWLCWVNGAREREMEMGGGGGLVYRLQYSMFDSSYRLFWGIYLLLEEKNIYSLTFHQPHRTSTTSRVSVGCNLIK